MASIAPFKVSSVYEINRFHVSRAKSNAKHFRFRSENPILAPFNWTEPNFLDSP
jgi:hypothetical protein